MWEPQHPTTLWAFTACYGVSLTFYFPFCLKIVESNVLCTLPRRFRRQGSAVSCYDWCHIITNCDVFSTAPPPHLSSFRSAWSFLQIPRTRMIIYLNSTIRFNSEASYLHYFKRASPSKGLVRRSKRTTRVSQGLQCSITNGESQFNCSRIAALVWRDSRTVLQFASKPICYINR
jgi:hypothetical protein